MSKHTPGPWKVFICDDGKQWTGWPLSISATNVTNANGDPRTVVRTGGQYPYEWDHGTSRDEAVANARLIAAAPDLLEALKMAVECGMVPTSSAAEGGANRHVKQLHVADQIRAAIAKAEGR